MQVSPLIQQSVRSQELRLNTSGMVSLDSALSSEPMLHCPDFEQLFIIQTDASDRGLGAVLLQGLTDRHPVAFISRKLYPREVRYSTVEKECLAVKWAIDSLKYYLLGRKFVLDTDHKALTWLKRMKDTNSRITRWYNPLSFRSITFQAR